MEPLYVIKSTATKKDAQKHYFHLNKISLMIMRILCSILTLNGLCLFIYLQYVSFFSIWSFLCLIYAFFYPRIYALRWEKRIRYKYNQDYLTYREEFYEDHFRSINLETNSTYDTNYNRIKRIVETKSDIILILKYKIDNSFISKSDCGDYQEFLSFLSSKVK